MKSILCIFIYTILSLAVHTVYAQLYTIRPFVRADNQVSEVVGEVKASSIKPNTCLEPDTTSILINVRPLFYAPLKKLVMTSGYGLRKHPVTGVQKFHSGIDLKAFYEPVYAVADGMVVYSGTGVNEGNYVIIGHGAVETIYCHLSELRCKRGDLLRGGTVLGISGNTGRSTGPHLHFGMRYLRSRVDPQKFFDIVRWVAAN